jgi:hypothetical protein
MNSATPSPFCNQATREADSDAWLVAIPPTTWRPGPVSPSWGHCTLTRQRRAQHAANVISSTGWVPSGGQWEVEAVHAALVDSTLMGPSSQLMRLP